MPFFFLHLLAPFFVAGAFEPLAQWYLAPIGYAIYLSYLQRQRRTIFYSLYFAFSANLIILVWSGAFVGALPWIALSLLQALYFLPIGVLARYTTRTPILITAILAMEEVKARFPFGGFSWTRVAFSQIDSPLAPVISIGGALALSFATLLLSYLFIYRKTTTALVLLFLAIVPSLLLPTYSSTDKLTFNAVQGGTPSKGLDFNSRAMGVFNMHLEESYRSTTGREDLLIWPENAIDIDPFDNLQLRAKISQLIDTTGVPLLAGAVLAKGPINAAILFREDGKLGSMYFKRYLTPFGEYIPLRKIAEKLSPHTDRVNDFEPGQAIKVHTVEIDGMAGKRSVKVSSIICFEILNDGIVRESAQLSGVMVVLTNSATFAGTAEGDQQLAITRLRALEHNRAVISISTTGPSAIIDERGVVGASLADGDIGSISGQVPVLKERTIADLLGGWAPIATILLAVVWSAFTSRRVLFEQGKSEKEG